MPDQVYVPYYDPAVVYGAWPYPDYPPYYFEPPYYIGTGLLATGLAFGAGYAIGRWGGWWNGGVNWSGGGNNIVINRPGGRPTNPIAGVGNRWQPRVDHRQALGNRGGQQVQRDFRGTNGKQVLNPNNRAGSRNNVANRNNATNKAAAKNRAFGLRVGPPIFSTPTSRGTPSAARPRRCRPFSSRACRSSRAPSHPASSPCTRPAPLA